jgi:hypothetical protein
MLSSRNKAAVDAALQDLSQRLGFRYTAALAERVVFREYFPRGVTALDELNEATLGSRPTMSHLSAQLEVQSLVRALLNIGTIEEPAQEAHAASSPDGPRGPPFGSIRPSLTAIATAWMRFRASSFLAATRR